MSSEQVFERQIKGLIEETVSLNANTPLGLATFAVMPGSLKRGESQNRLEEYVIDQLRLYLLRYHETYTFNRENWLEYREGQPLDFARQPEAPHRW